MLGAIAGDIIGSPYERRPIKSTDFPLFSLCSTFTDDSVMTVAVADVLLDGGDYVESFHRYFDMYPHAGYGAAFGQWALTRSREPYGSFGNGSAMRVSPVGYVFDTLDETLYEARRTAEVTHDHPEGIKGAQAVSAAIYLARNGESKDRIAEYITGVFDYNLGQPLDRIRTWYSFDVTCQGTVPVALRALMESDNWEHAVRLAVSMGGDSDTVASIAGALAEAFYGGVPDEVAENVRRILAVHGPPLLEVTDAFALAYSIH